MLFMEEHQIKNIRKKTLLIVCIVIIALVGVYIAADNLYVRSCEITADRITLAKDFKSLGKESDLIVLAAVLPGKENVLLKEEDGTIIFGYTLMQLKVEKVFSGKTEENTLKITEEYYITKDIIGNTIWTQGSYVPAEVGSSYIFFPKKYSSTSKYSGMYFPIDLEYGKYLINQNIKNGIDNLSNKEIEVGNNSDKKYREWMKEVLKKYVDYSEQ